MKKRMRTGEEANVREQKREDEGVEMGVKKGQKRNKERMQKRSRRDGGMGMTEMKKRER